MSNATVIAHRWNCQNCGYNLQGLPLKHSCPECGMLYDPHMVIIKLRGPRERLIHFVGHPSDALVILIASLLVLNGRYRWVSEPAMCGTCVLLVVVYALFRFCFFIARRQRPRRMILNHQGVYIDHPGLDSKRIEWSHIERAHYRWWSGRFFIRGHGVKLFKCAHTQLGGARLARRCAREINRLVKIYASESGSQSARSGSGPA